MISTSQNCCPVRPQPLLLTFTAPRTQDHIFCPESRLPIRHRLGILAIVVSLTWTCGAAATAAVERFKVESEYLARINELEHGILSEGFESSAWDEVRSPDVFDRHSLPEIISQGLLWEPASKDLFGGFGTRVHGLTTNHNWARSGEWGVYEDHAGDIGYPTSIRISSVSPMYGVGGWFNTNPDGQSVGFLFEDRTTANEPGYYLPGYGAMYPGDNPSFGHEFSGIIDPDGFHAVVLTGTLEVNEKNVLEGGTIYGADDFTIAVAPLLQADFNSDGRVDGSDFLIWQTNFPTPQDAAMTDGDANGDGDVDGEDFLTWQLEFAPAPESRAASRIPEPPGVLLAGSLGCLLGATVHRKR